MRMEAVLGQHPSVRALTPSLTEKLLMHMRACGEAMFADLQYGISVGEKLPTSLYRKINQFMSSAVLVNYYWLA